MRMRAGDKLLQQAIERTELEARAPQVLWGPMSSISGHYRLGFRKHEIERNAAKRLRILERLRNGES